MATGFIFALAVLIISVVVHEVSHGYAAYIMGDPTAKLAGRLTLNPIKHVDPLGSIVVPLIMALLPGGIILGWAKPVPYNPHNLKVGKYGPTYVALAGPASNLFLALIFGLTLRFSDLIPFFSPALAPILSTVVLINLMLAIFNLIPVPPLDGSVIFLSFLSERSKIKRLLQKYQIVFILGIILLAGLALDKILYFVHHLITGL